MSINVKQAKRYCCEELSKIENYDKDEVKVLPSGIVVFRSVGELKENGRYYHCLANELVFLTRKEHQTLHTKGNKELGRKFH